MVRMVTKDDLTNHPEFLRMGISVNQYFDFDEKKEHKLLYQTPDYEVEISPVDYGAFAPKLKKTISQNWTKKLDKIYVINLNKRKDRMLNATLQLSKYNIHFERVEAIEHKKGAEGLKLTIEKLFKDCIEKGYQNVLIFEDDVDIVEPTINDVMQKVVSDLPPNYDIIYLGCNLCAEPKEYYSNYLLSGVMSAFATHAAIYSQKAMKMFLEGNPFEPIDNFIVAHIQTKGNCYCTAPLLASQIVTHSDIYSDTELMDWKPYLEKKYPDMIKNVKKK